MGFIRIPKLPRLLFTRLRIVSLGLLCGFVAPGLLQGQIIGEVVQENAHSTLTSHKNLLLRSEGSLFEIVDNSDVAAPRRIGAISIGANIAKILARDSTVYLLTLSPSRSSKWARVHAIDVSVPSAPKFISSEDIGPSFEADIWDAESYLCAKADFRDYCHVAFFNISGPLKFVKVELGEAGAQSLRTQTVFPKSGGGLCGLQEIRSGEWAVNIWNREPDGGHALVGQRILPAGTSPQEFAVAGHSACFVDGAGNLDGSSGKRLAVLDLRDSASPRLAGKLDLEDEIGNLQTDGADVIAFTYNSFVAVVDLGDPDAPRLRSFTSFRRNVGGYPAWIGKPSSGQIPVYRELSYFVLDHRNFDPPQWVYGSEGMRLLPAEGPYLELADFRKRLLD